MKNSFILLFITLILNCSMETVVYAEVIPDTIINFGRVEGINADYYFYIPISWKDYISVERDTNLKNGAKESLHFYYNPSDKEQEKYLFYTLYIFEYDDFNDSTSFNFVAEIENYIFVSKEYLNYNTTNYVDNIIFNRFKSELNNRDFIGNKVDVISSNNYSNGQYNNVYVNNHKLNNTSFVSSNDITYLPVREICELIGFDVSWNNSNKSVVIKNNSFTDVIYLRSKNTYTPVVIDGNVYMPSMYFVNFLELDVNIDSKSNVKIYT